ncbi:Gfo/Idh/MocA family oxidoreductase, partial [Pseudomonadales bacterium]|nr:Gfo/Idh/MocA family oxidoreductase [Pseudomonadales bacterium]
MAAFGVIGMGSIAQKHIVNLRQLHPDDKVYVVSASGNNANKPSDADAVITIQELISIQPQYVIIASPAPLHVNTAIRLLSAGIPVLIEKPLSDDFQSCAEFQAINGGGLTTSAAVGYCLRFLPSTIVVKDYIDKGLLGKIYNVESHVGQYLPTWRKDKPFKDSVSAQKKLGGGALLELSHELDYLFWFFGELTLQHSWLRTTPELGLDVEDIANLVLTNPDDVYVTLHLDFVQKTTQRKCSIIGENGRLEWDLMSNSVNVFDVDGSTVLYS